MNRLAAGALALASDPTPNPTEGTLRPGLEEWQVSPGLVGFLVTFVLAVACVLLFLNMSKHLRRAGHNARAQGLPTPTPQVLSFRRADEDAAAPSGSASPDADASPSDSPGDATSGGTGSDRGGPGA